MRGLDTTENLTYQINYLTDKKIDFVGRYVNLSSAWKRLGTLEAEKLSSAGISIFPIFELNPTSGDYFSRERGVRDYDESLASIAAYKIPSSAVMFYTVDYDAPPEDIPKIIDYFSAIVESARLRRANGYDYPGVGAYGSGYVLGEILARWPVITWLSMSSGWRGYEDWRSHADVLQSVGDSSSFDFDYDISDKNYGYGGKKC